MRLFIIIFILLDIFILSSCSSKTEELLKRRQALLYEINSLKEENEQLYRILQNNLKAVYKNGYCLEKPDPKYKKFYQPMCKNENELIALKSQCIVKIWGCSFGKFLSESNVNESKVERFIQDVGCTYLINRGRYTIEDFILNSFDQIPVLNIFSFFYKVAKTKDLCLNQLPKICVYNYNIWKNLPLSCKKIKAKILENNHKIRMLEKEISIINNELNN